jgi:hypothetical protein
MVRKSQELRPVMTRIPEGLRSKLAREGKKNGRSMNAEIVYRLEQSFEHQDIITAVREAIISPAFIAGFNDAWLMGSGKDDAELAAELKRALRDARGSEKEQLKRALKELGIDPGKPHEEDKS